ncbi:MAG: PAS domain S-box protein [Cyanothece sp. SIO1E1]|nr:PAS domain S-box protein [Cyanothece sp. SIO1E1]
MEPNKLHPNGLALAQVIDRHPLTMAPIASLVEVARLMTHSRYCGGAGDGVCSGANGVTPVSASCVLIVQDAKLMGIFTQRDLVTLIATGKTLAEITLAEVMIQPVVTLKITGSESIFTALNLLHQHHIRHLPILGEHEQLIGLVTSEDILRQLQPVVNQLQAKTADLQQRYTQQAELYRQAQIELKAHEHIEVSLRQERNLVSAVLTVAGALVVVLDPQGRIVRFNQTCTQVTGYSFDEVRGQCVWDVLVPEAEQAAVRTVFTALRDGHFPNDYDNHWRTKDGELRLIAWANTALFDDQDRVEYVIGTGIDITERRQAENALKQQAEHEQLLGAIASRIRQSLNLQDILNTTVAEVRQLLQTDRVVIFRFEPDGDGIVQVESVKPGWMSILNMKIHDPCFKELCMGSTQPCHVTAIEDIYTTGLAPCYIDLLTQFQVRANLVVPLLQGEQLWGLLIAHHCSAPRHWQQSEIHLLTQLATQLAIAIQQSELYQQLQAELNERQRVEVVLQEAKDELELRVAERTAELINVNEKIQRELNQRKQVEEALRVSKARFAGILDIANDAIIAVDTHQRITLFNQGAERIFGYTAQAILGCPLDVLLPIRFAQKHRRYVANFSNTPSQARRMGERNEIFGRRQDGTEFPAEASISRLELGEEVIFTVILRDVTKRKQAEKTLAQLSHQNELLLNSISEGLCGLNRQARITFANPAAAKLLGYPVETLINQPVSIIFNPTKVSDHSISTAAVAIEASLTDGITSEAINTLFQCQDGSSFPVEYVSTPIREQDEIVGAVITFKDISDRQIVERMKDEFISVVSHELRTPLTSIHGSLKMLSSGLLNAQPDKSQRLLEIAVNSTDRLVRLINDILDVERIESGKVKMVKQICNVANLMTQAANTMQAMADKAAVTLSVSTLSAQLWGDPDRIMQTLTNLLSNAIKFSSPGGTVWLTAELKQSFELKAQTQSLELEAQTQPSPLNPHPASPTAYVLFSVRDHGRGIPADKIETIFERFQQADSSDSRNHEGTGLGLAICRSIVQQHNGQIWVESYLGKGSTFHFIIPNQTHLS